MKVRTLMSEDDYDRLNGYTADQVAGIFAKLETARLLIKLGTDMASQAETDLRFYKMTNGATGAASDDSI